MSFSNLLNELAGSEKFPIQLSQITSWLKENTSQDNIYFEKVQIDSDKLTATHHRRYGINEPYKDAPCHFDVIFSHQLNDCERRYYCCKEILHIFDPEDARVSDRESLSTLISELVNMNALPRQAELSKYTSADIDGYKKALMVLAPLKAVDELRPAFEKGEITKHQVALFFKIPESHISYLFSESYANLYVEYKNEVKLKVA